MDGKAALHGYTPSETYKGNFKSKTISLWQWQSALLHSKQSVDFKERDCISHMLQCFGGIHERMDNSCKRRAEYLHHSFVIFHSERGQWQASFIREKSAYLAEVSVTEQILRKFPNSQKPWGNWACTNSVYQALFFSAHALQPENEATTLPKSEISQFSSFCIKCTLSIR